MKEERSIDAFFVSRLTRVNIDQQKQLEREVMVRQGVTTRTKDIVSQAQELEARIFNIIYDETHENRVRYGGRQFESQMITAALAGYEATTFAAGATTKNSPLPGLLANQARYHTEKISIRLLRNGILYDAKNAVAWQNIGKRERLTLYVGASSHIQRKDKDKLHRVGDYLLRLLNNTKARYQSLKQLGVGYFERDIKMPAEGIFYETAARLRDLANQSYHGCVLVTYPASEGKQSLPLTASEVPPWLMLNQYVKPGQSFQVLFEPKEKTKGARSSGVDKVASEMSHMLETQTHPEYTDHTPKYRPRMPR